MGRAMFGLCWRCLRCAEWGMMVARAGQRAGVRSRGLDCFRRRTDEAMCCIA